MTVDVEEEKMGNLAGREPHIPVAICGELGCMDDVLRLGTSLQLIAGRVDGEMFVDEVGENDESPAVWKPTGTKAPEREVSDRLWVFVTAERNQVNLLLAFDRCEEGESLAVGGHDRLRRVEVLRGERLPCAFVHEPKPARPLIGFDVVGGHRHDEFSGASRHRRSHSWESPESRSGQRLHV